MNKLAILIGIPAFWLASLIVTYFVASEPAQLTVERTGPEATEVVVVKQIPEWHVLPPEQVSGANSIQGTEGQGSLGSLDGALLPQPTAAPHGSSTLPTATYSAINRDLRRALSSDDFIQRNLVTAQLLAQVTPENAQDFLAVFEDAKRDYHGDNNYRMFLHAWARVDGQAAMQYLFSEDARNVGHGRTWAMAGWAQADPASAFDFVQGIEDDRQRHSVYHGLVRGWARQNLDAAAGHVATLDGKLRSEMTGIIAERQMEYRGRNGVLNWVTDISYGEDQIYAREVFNHGIKQAVRDNGIEVAQWIDRNPENPNIKDWVFEEAADEWAESDPRAAANWLESHMDDERVTGKVIAEFTDEWAKTDGAAAAQWADNYRGTTWFTDKTAGRLAGEWAVNDPNGALDWADTLDDGHRKSAYGYIVRQWEDREQAGAWLSDAPVDSSYDEARAHFTGRIAKHDPIQALEHAGQITDPKARERSLVYAAQVMYKREPDAVTAWFPVSGLSEDAQRRVMNPKQRR